MASKFPGNSKVEMKARKGHDMTWSCDIHLEPISFHCKNHNISVCHRCATKDHQKPCQLEDIGSIILERGKQLQDRLLEINEKKLLLQRLESKIEACVTVISNHFEEIDEALNATYEGKIQNVKDKERRVIDVINADFDEEIRIINEKRDKRIKECATESEQQQLLIRGNQAKGASDSKKLKGAFINKVEDYRGKNKHEADALDNMVFKIIRIKQKDSTLVGESPHIIESFGRCLTEDDGYEEQVDCIVQVQREVRAVKVVKGAVGGEPYARIEGYTGKWELVRSIQLSSTSHYPSVCGLISNDEVVFVSNNHDLHVTHISSQHTQKVLEGERNEIITSCAPLNSNVVVCGKWRRHCVGDNLDGCITLYDRQWKLVRNITIPKNTSNPRGSVYVDEYGDGMIVAGEPEQSLIYVINPVDGDILNTIDIKDKIVSGRIQAMSSGDIVVHTGLSEFTIFSSSGKKKATMLCDGWLTPWCCVDKLTDKLYVTYRDAKRQIYTVDQVSREGFLEAKRIVTYATSDRLLLNRPCFITPNSGKLVGCNKDMLLVYKNSFMV